LEALPPKLSEISEESMSFKSLDEYLMRQSLPETFPGRAWESDGKRGLRLIGQGKLNQGGI
jgi:hypothetical protein